MNKTERLIAGCAVALIATIGISTALILSELKSLNYEVAVPRREAASRRLFESQEALKRAQEDARR